MRHTPKGFLLFVFISALLNIKTVHAQIIESKFLRPSMTILYLAEKDAERQKIMNAIINSSEKLPSEISSERFDKLAIGSKVVTLPGISQRPTLPPNQGNAADILNLIAYNRQIRKYNKNIEVKLTNELHELSKDVIKALFKVDQNGNMSDELIRARGLYSATDADVIKDRASEISRLSNIGFSLLERSYIVVYQLDEVVKIDKRYYDELDRLNKAAYDKLAKKGLMKDPFTPAYRSEEGYKVSFKSYTYKISKTWLDNFFDSYWVTADTPIQVKNRKITAFNQAVIPVELVSIDNGKLDAVDSYGSNPPVDKLFQNAAEEIQNISFYKNTKEVSDLATRATINQAYPILVKIGTKEDVYVEQRYFVYETQKKTENDIGKSKLVGVVKAKAPIANNNQSATGNSLSTTFVQTYGKKLSQGMYLVQKDNTNQNIQLEYYPTKIGSGFSVSYEFGWSYARAFGQTIKQKDKGLNNLFVGLDLIFLPELAVFTLAVGKEFYLLPNGNIFLHPKLGLGYNVDEEGFAINPSVGLGFNATPWFTLVTKYNYFNGSGSQNGFFSVGCKFRF